MTNPEQWFERANRLLDRLESFVPAQSGSVDIDTAPAFRWRQRGQGKGYLQAVSQLSDIKLADLLCIDRQKQLIKTNTEQFLIGAPANNVLLWGPKGTGKSSLIRALFNEYRDRDLKLVEVDRLSLGDLPDIVDSLHADQYRYLIYCDDLSFSANDENYKSLKVVLDGSICKTPENILIYATSNRRHLMPESMQDNLDSGFKFDELHMSEAVEEKISLSERFGLWLSFQPFNQDQYLSIVDHWLSHYQVANTANDTEARAEALKWALQRGSRSGRSAWQFAKHRAGMKKLESS